MFVFNENVKIENCGPGVTRKILAYSKELMMVEMGFEKGAEGAIHHHPHLQVTYVAKGSFEFTVNGEMKIIKQGDSVYMSADDVHGVKALEEGILVDVFNPMREDFIKE